MLAAGTRPRTNGWSTSRLVGAFLVILAALAWAPAASAEQAGSELRSLQAGLLDAGDFHSCAVLESGAARCWGDGTFGRLGYGNTNNIGDGEAPGSVNPVDLGAGRTARAIAAGSYHTCALLDDATVRCWGYGNSGALGYGNTNDIGDNEAPGSVGPVNLGAGRTARAITAGFYDTCAILDDGSVRCWGSGLYGKLGYGNTNDIGDTETPGSVGPVNLGAGRTARAISAGDTHTCALLDNNTVRCWGDGSAGELGYVNTDTIGDTETPGSVGPVDLGGYTARAISAGASSTCALKDNHLVLCWGSGADGRLGYGDINNIGDTETPGSKGQVPLGVSDVRGISAGGNSTCALVSDGTVRCWGRGSSGQLGYGNTDTIGDNEFPSTVAAPAYLAGLITPSVGDLSLAISANAPTRTVGDSSTITLTLTNSGPDSVPGARVGYALPAGLAFQSATASQGSYDAQTGTWDVGTIINGVAPTLQVVARVTSAGTLTSSAEVSAAGAPDPDSTPANGAAGEDDRATASITATAAATPAAVADTTAPGITLARVRRSMKLKSFLKGLKVQITASEASRLDVELLGSARKATLSKAFNVVLAKANLPLSAAARNLKLKPSRRLVGRARRLTVQLRVIATDAAGNRTTQARTIKVKR